MFSSSRGGTLTIWLSDPNGSNLVELGTQAGRPNAWSPDGRQILFDGGRAPGRVADIFVMSVDGGRTQKSDEPAERRSTGELVE